MSGDEGTVTVTAPITRFLGEEPRRLVFALWPPLAVVALDRLVRGELVHTSTPLQWGVYALGVAIGGLAWIVSIWTLATLWGAGRKRAAAVLFGVLLVPLALGSFPVQLAYFRYAHAYASANTLPVAWQLRGTVKSGILGSWPTALPGLLFAVLFLGLLVLSARALARSLCKTEPLLPLAAGALFLVLTLGDRTWTKGVSALPPDASFVASVVGGLAAPGDPRGLTVRTPLPVPPLVASRKRDVVLVISESLRADVLASSRDPARPSALDDVVGARLGLSRMTSQASSTVISCVSTWTGLPPDLDIVTAHRAPLLFEMAKAAGYRTVYVGAQRGDFQRLGVFLQVAGLDVHVHGEELDSNAHEEAGAPDDRATKRALVELGKDPQPTFLVLHLSSTHYPYRIDDALTPHKPMTTSMSEADKPALWNRYRNGVLLQERILRDFFRDLAALPSHREAISVFVSDHGEQFYEHGAFSHIRSLHDEELRVPAFVTAGPGALSSDERAALASYAEARVYNQDLTATVIDLLGLWDERARIPYAEKRLGRSLLRPKSPEEPLVLLANANGIWGIDRPAFGAMQGEKKVVGRETTPWACFDVASDPAEKKPLPLGACGPVADAARRAFPAVPVP